MSSQVRAEILLSLKDEFSKPAAKAGEAGKSALKDLNQGAAGAIQSLTGLNVASVGLVAGIGAVAAGLKYAVDQAAEAEKIFAVTEAVVKSTGGAAGLTADQISNMAGRLSQLNAVDDEVILSAQNVLLTFKKIKGEAFEQASQAALDLSVVMGGDLRGSMLMIGKALEDPIRGITALRRAGVSFTEDQRALIKELVETGRQAEAMNIILTEVNSQVGGAGAAAADTYAGKMALLKINVDNLAQALGEKLIPPLTNVVTAMNLLITWSDKVEAAYDEQIDRVTKTAQTYEEYEAQVIQTAVAAGILTKSEAAHIAAVASGERTHETALYHAAEYRERLDLLTPAQHKATLAVEKFGVAAHAAGWALRKNVEEQANAEQAAQAYSDRLTGLAAAYGMAEGAGRNMYLSTMDVKGAMDDLQILLSGDLGQANDDYYAQQKEAGALIAESIGKLEKLRASHGQVATSTIDGADAARQLIIAQSDAQTAVENLWTAQEKLREDPGNLGLQASVARAEGALVTAQGHVEEWSGKIKAANEGFVIDNSAAITATEEELVGLQGAYSANADAHDRSTRRILFNMLTQQLATDGLEEHEYRALAGVAESWDLLDRDTAVALSNMGGNIAALNQSGDWRQFVEDFTGIESKEVTVTVNHHTNYTQYGAEPGPGVPLMAPPGPLEPGGPDSHVPPVGPPGPQPGFARGANFIVPPGYPNDSFGMRVQSGEHVQVTPAGQLGAGTVINISIDARGSDVDEISAKLAGQLRRRLFIGAAYQGA